MTTPTDVELMKAAVQHSHELYKLPTSRAAFQAGALFASQTLAKWGQPQAVAVGEPSASLAEWRRLEYIERAYDIAKGGQHGAE